MDEKSCVGCKYLYIQDEGCSNYTVTDEEVRCALDKNPNLPRYKPWDWETLDDNWFATNSSRCDKYSVGVLIELDVDEEDTVESQSQDKEQIEAIQKHSGRK